MALLDGDSVAVLQLLRTAEESGDHLPIPLRTWSELQSVSEIGSAHRPLNETFVPPAEAPPR